MYKFELSLEELNVVLMGLGKLPLESSIVVFGKLRQEVDKQMKEANAPTADSSDS